MEANGFKTRLKEAKDNSEFVKVIFQYPSSPKAIIRRGPIVRTYDDCFVINDIRDGLMTFSYSFIAEISSTKKGELNDGDNRKEMC